MRNCDCGAICHLCAHQGNLYQRNVEAVEPVETKDQYGNKGVAFVPVRATDPDTSWRAWFEIEPDWTERQRDLHQLFVARGRYGFTYSELADCTDYPGVSTSTMIAQLERMHQVVRRLDRDGKESSRLGVTKGSRHQKVMVATQVANEVELRCHVERWREKPNTLRQEALAVADELERICHAMAEGMELCYVDQDLTLACVRLRRAAEK